MDRLTKESVLWGLVIVIAAFITCSILRVLVPLEAVPIRIRVLPPYEVNGGESEESEQELVESDESRARAHSTATVLPPRRIRSRLQSAPIIPASVSSPSSLPRVRVYASPAAELIRSQLSQGGNWPTLVESASAASYNSNLDINTRSSRRRQQDLAESEPLLSREDEQELTLAELRSLEQSTRQQQGTRELQNDLEQVSRIRRLVSSMVSPISPRVPQAGSSTNSSDKTAQPKKSYTKEQWASRLSETDVSKTVLNYLIMNYLIVEGYESAAERFAQEANIAPTSSVSSMKQRMAIKSMIHSGNIQGAIEKINDIDPELLDVNPALHFSLLRLQLIELIRQGFKSKEGDIQPALDFATSHLAQKAPSNPQFLQDLEKTMALLCFPPDSLVPQLQALMDIKLRRRVAEDVNEALLRRQGMMGDSKIENLVKLWGWGENQLSLQGVEFPVIDAKDFI